MKHDKPPFEEFEHPADIGLRVRGESLPELFQNAGLGMIQLMLDPATVQAREAKPIGATGDETEALLVAWLNEVLFAFDAEGFAPCRVEVESFVPGEVRGRLLGEPLDEARHQFRNAIKAVTWHKLNVVKRAGMYQVEIIFDV